MKLYLMATSERGKELGKGGNKHIRAVFMGEMADGTRKELCHIYIEPCSEGYAIHVSDHYGNDLYEDIFEDETKSEQDELAPIGINCPECYAIDPTGNTDCPRHQK